MVPFPVVRAQPLRLVAALCLLCTAAPLRAAPQLRYQVELRGDLAVIGNTVGYDCRAAIPKPVVGAVDVNACGAATSDSEIDVLWRADEPAAGQAAAGPAVTPADARSTAVLTLPEGARVAYARLYWAAAQGPGSPPGQVVLLERPGLFMQSVSADASAKVDGTSSYYQSSADVTELVQDLGPGPFRVGAIPAASPVDVDSRLSFVAWSLVVFYQHAAEPPRNLTLFDGLDRIDDTRPASAQLERFLVPEGRFDGRLAILAYEGDAETAGDRIRIGGQDLGDALNPADNFFNGTRSRLGQALSTPGDLPQMSGQPGSMNGVDLDVVDVTDRLRAGAASLAISAQSSEDVYFLGALAGAVATYKPVLETHLSYVNLSRPGGPVRPGDLLELTLSVRNVGTDTAVDVRAGWTAPPGLRYEPGSLRVARGPGGGTKTDAAGDDQGEYDEPGRALSLRLGEGADAKQGGRLGVEESLLVRFRARVTQDAQGQRVRTQGTTRAAGEAGTRAGIPPLGWASGDGRHPNRPVSFVPRECQAHGDCPARAPRCDAAAGRCGNGCQADGDCAGAATGARCLPAQRCGCQADGDCPSGACDTAAGRCRIPEANLAIDVRMEPDPPSRGLPVAHVVTVTNRGPEAAPGVEVVIDLPPGTRVREGGVQPGDGWQCEVAGEVVRCRRAAPLPPGAAPSIRVIVAPPAEAPAVDVTATVTSPFADDPDPSDNGVHRSADLSDDLVQLAGGGLGCALAARSQGAAQLLSLLAFSLCWLLLRRRARP